MKLRQFTVFAGVLAIFAAAPAFAEEAAAPANAPAAVSGEAAAPSKAKLGDTDGDGLISKDEFLAKQEERFTEMDKNSDGKLEDSELSAYKAKMNAIYGKMRQKMKDAGSAPVAE